AAALSLAASRSAMVGRTDAGFTAGSPRCATALANCSHIWVSFKPDGAGASACGSVPLAGVKWNCDHVPRSKLKLYGLSADPSVPSTCQRGSGRVVVVLISTSPA